MTIQVRRIETIAPGRAQAFGGKAKNLAAMARAGLPVPAAYAVSSDLAGEVFRAVLGPDDQPEALLRAPAREVTDARLAELRERVLRAPLAAEAQALLSRALEDLLKRGAKAVAVRSSSVLEDDEQRSAAGIHDSVLGVTDDAALFSAVRQVVASVLTPRAMTYLRIVAHEGARGAVRELPASHVGMVLQALVRPEVAGVLFTANPISGDGAEILVNAAYGLGTAVVDGTVSPDTWRIDKATGWIRDHVVGQKEHAARFVLGEGIRVQPIAPEDQRRACLTDAQLERLVALGKRVEGQLGSACDLEWALAKDTLFVLQARPITALEKARSRRSKDPRTPQSRARTVWSNLNVGEALPGVATPLTWSVLSKFSDAGFRRAFAALGCSVPDDAELVGNFRGRIYLNMSEFTAIAAQVPGLSPRTILSLGGGGEIDTLEREVPKSGRTAFTLRLPMTATRFVRENYQLTKRVEAWEESFAAEKARALSVDLRVLSSGAVRQVLRDVERMLDSAGLMMLNVYGNLLGTIVALRTLLHTLGNGERATTDRRLRELSTGLEGVDSAAPGLELVRIAEVARNEAAVRAVFEAGLPQTPSDLPPGSTRTLIEAFLTRFGERGTREAEIAEPRWREDPALILSTLRLHVRAPHLASAESIEARQRKIRDETTRAVLAEVPFLLRGPAQSLIELTQHFLRLRERLRAHVVTVLGLYRRVALDVTRRIQAMEAGTSDGALDGAAFFLTIDELHALLAGDARKVAPLVATRRLQYQRDAALPPPPDTFVGQPPPPEVPGDVVLLRGLPASGGKVEGRARVLRHPSEAHKLEPGEILVAPQADVGLSPLFLAARAVLADLGGPLSHASIVARELGIPAVVNLKNATTLVRDGDLVAVDGDEGTVRILERA